ncbi:MAG: metalloregulator ArsR/SmtB family transcription factor [Lachnospiraceae bacterium]|nr:metalloregulator ArsR/SmtB family transcription factor [Lachnospiraceae bacterium]
MSEQIHLPHNHNHDGKEHFSVHAPDIETINVVADAMKQLGDPSRLRIYWLLCHTEECVANIAALVDMSSPAVSHHLRVLKAAGLIVSRRDGKEMLYKAADNEMADAMHHYIEKLAKISCPWHKD